MDVRQDPHEAQLPSAGWEIELKPRRGVPLSLMRVRGGRLAAVFVPVFFPCSDGGGPTARLVPHCLLERSTSARTIGGVAACPRWGVVTASPLLS